MICGYLRFPAFANVSRTNQFAIRILIVAFLRASVSVVTHIITCIHMRITMSMEAEGPEAALQQMQGTGTKNNILSTIGTCLSFHFFIISFTLFYKIIFVSGVALCTSWNVAPVPSAPSYLALRTSTSLINIPGLSSRCLFCYSTWRTGAFTYSRLKGRMSRFFINYNSSDKFIYYLQCTTFISLHIWPSEMIAKITYSMKI